MSFCEFSKFYPDFSEIAIFKKFPVISNSYENLFYTFLKNISLETQNIENL